MQIGRLVDRAKDLGYEALAVTDTMTLAGMPTFFEKAKKAGIKPVIGCVLRIVTDPAERVKDREQHGYRIKVYAKGERGLQSLYKLLSLGLQKDHYYYHSRVSLDEVIATLEDVVVTTGDLHSIWHHHDATSISAQLSAKFGEDYYIELVALATPLFDKLNKLAAECANAYLQKVIVTRPVFYETDEDADSTDVLRAISTNTAVSSIFVARPHVRSMCLLSAADTFKSARDCLAISELDRPLESLFRANQALIDSCSYEYKKLAPSLPKMADNEFVELTRRVAQGWSERFARKVWGHCPAVEDMPKYKERLTYELGVLKKLNFPGYFLLVQDIVRWAKSKGILVGPGRGSVGGSLVAYLMGITDIDPIRFDLLFERFINPDRLDLPDADLDFMSRRRHEIIDMLVSQYGEEHVCGIVNFNTLGPAGAIRDVARMHGLQPYEYACSKSVEKEHGVNIPLIESGKLVPEIEKFSKEHPVIWEHALRLEGANRSLGTHAAGVVVCAEPIINRGVVSTLSGQSIVQWDKSRVEDFGLIKIDVLGLNTLDVIGAVVSYIEERHHKKIDVLALPLDDERVLKAFGKGDTTGIFQFEGGGMKKLLRDLAVGGDLTFDDICATTALFRPGPLDAGLCDRYVQVKQGHATPFYEHPALEECLSDTFGVIVYQEQVMKICRVLCNFTPGESDGVRKAIGKKDAVKMAEFGEKFVAGAVTSGMSEFAAKTLWEMILGFAGYAFNKSHSYEYSLISWITMWLKVYYPAEFYAGALSVVEIEERQASLIIDAQNNGLHVLPPDVVKSTTRIEIEGEDKLYAPFQSVKGISENTAEAIVDMRRHFGTLTWVEETSRTLRSSGGKPGRVEVTPAHIAEFSPENQKLVLGRTKINAKALESLGRVGAFVSVCGGVPAMHTDRLRDRLELMPGFTVEVVKASRGLSVETFAKIKITAMQSEIEACEGCSLKGKPHPSVRMGAKPRFMVVFDSPSFKEEKAGKLLAGEAGDLIQAALKDVGLKTSDGYYTTLVKAAKPNGVKALTNEQINGCSKWLDQEIETLKPGVIVAMGSNAVRYFAPGLKGSPADLVGKAIYRADLDATIIFGMNPGMVYFDPSKITLVESVFAKLNEVLS